MPTYKRFEDLPVWQSATDLAVAIFRLTSAEAFRFRGDLVNQLRRAVLSIPNNIAEGFERGTTSELITFLYIARGSAGEVRSMLRFAPKLDGMEADTPAIERLIPACESVSRQLRAWLDNLQNSDIAGQRHLTDASRSAYDQQKRESAFVAWLNECTAIREQSLRDGTWNTPNRPKMPPMPRSKHLDE